ncbi:ribosome modulation factor [Ralstonia sp. ASV6]|nr:ribosome modulation factor [Ralstonia sp. ASV6]
MVNEKRAYREGRVAWINGVSINACPYTDPQLRTAWVGGWIERDKGGLIA